MPPMESREPDLQNNNSSRVSPNDDTATSPAFRACRNDTRRAGVMAQAGTQGVRHPGPGNQQPNGSIGSKRGESQDAGALEVQELRTHSSPLTTVGNFLGGQDAFMHKFSANRIPRPSHCPDEFETA